MAKCFAIASHSSRKQGPFGVKWPSNACCCDLETRPDIDELDCCSLLETASGMTVGCEADNRRALAFRTVRTLRRSKRESADSRKEIYANPTPLCWLDPALF